MIDLLNKWNSLRKWPGGSWIFSKVLGFFIPYTATISPLVEHLSAGQSRVRIVERRGIRNHLKSVHALALANAGELASGLAMIAALNKSTRSIVTSLKIDYLKKARGTLRALGAATPPKEISEPTESIATAEIVDESGDIVARVEVTWLLSPPRNKDKV